MAGLPRWPTLPIGLITGTLDVAEGREGTFDVVLAKPVTPADLRRALATLTGRRPGADRASDLP